jgi:hypothetical protein
MEPLRTYLDQPALAPRTSVLLAVMPSPAESPRPFTARESAARTREVRMKRPLPYNPDTTVVLPLEKSERNADKRILIGRAVTNDVVINHDSISKVHAAVEGSTLSDLDSRNGTFIAGKTLRPSGSLSDGCELRIGECSMRFLSEDAFKLLLAEMLEALAE